MAYTRAQIEQAQSMDLLSYVESQGYQLIRDGRQVRLKEHDSCVISNNKWKWFSQNKGGGTLDFLIMYENKSFKEAMQILLGEKEVNRKPIRYVKQVEIEDIKVLSQLPEKNDNYRRLYAYLGKTRGIDYEIITEMVKAGLLYEDKEHHNCVFLGKDDNGEVKYCLKVGTATDKKFKGELPGSDKRYNIELRNDKKNWVVCVYESIIDAMSHETLMKNQGKNYKKTNKISSGGVSDLKLEQYLKDNPKITKIITCYDNDEAGIKAALGIKEKYEKLGYTITKIVPKTGKDFNDELLATLKEKKKTLDDVKKSIIDYKPESSTVDSINVNQIERC